jgi:hypothetical protein
LVAIGMSSLRGFLNWEIKREATMGLSYSKTGLTVNFDAKKASSSSLALFGIDARILIVTFLDFFPSS